MSPECASEFHHKGDKGMQVCRTTTNEKIRHICFEVLSEISEILRFCFAISQKKKQNDNDDNDLTVGLLTRSYEVILSLLRGCEGRGGLNHSRGLTINI